MTLHHHQLLLHLLWLLTSMMGALLLSRALRLFSTRLSSPSSSRRAVRQALLLAADSRIAAPVGDGLSLLRGALPQTPVGVLRRALKRHAGDAGAALNELATWSPMELRQTITLMGYEAFVWRMQIDKFLGHPGEFGASPHFLRFGDEFQLSLSSVAGGAVAFLVHLVTPSLSSNYRARRSFLLRVLHPLDEQLTLVSTFWHEFSLAQRVAQWPIVLTRDQLQAMMHADGSVTVQVAVAKGPEDDEEEEDKEKHAEREEEEASESSESGSESESEAEWKEDDGGALCRLCHEQPPSCLPLCCKRLTACDACIQQRLQAEPPSEAKCPSCDEPISSERLVMGVKTE